jgi:hypothetical protein
VLAEDIVETFARDGVVVLRSAFPVDEASRLRAAIRHHVESRTPVRLDDRSTWGHQGSFGLGAVERRAIWSPVHESADVVHALDLLFGEQAWTAPCAPQVLLTFATRDEWRMPAGWHIDFGEDLPTRPVCAVKLFAFLDAVPPAGGGTLVLRGGHRVVERLAVHNGAPLGPGATVHALQSDPETRSRLWGGGRRHVLDEPFDVHGVTVQPFELTGEPGDVVLTHMHVLHSPAPNTATTPRMMIGSAFRAAPRATAGRAGESATPG